MNVPLCSEPGRYKDVFIPFSDDENLSVIFDVRTRATGRGVCVEERGSIWADVGVGVREREG